MVSRDKERLEELQKLMSRLPEDEAKVVFEKFQRGEKTGYPHIDMPWGKYHIGEYEEPENKKTVYQEVHFNNLDQPKTTALEFFMSKINYDQLSKNISKTAKSFEEYGIKKGDYVTIISAGIPEMVYSFYGLSKIGAVANLMGYYFDDNDLIERINDCESDLLIVMDKFYPKISNAINKSRIKNIVVVPTLNSSLLGILDKTYKPEKRNELLWNQFIKDGRNRKETSTVDYEPNMPLAMVYSSGTTGASKGILLSNDSFQNSLSAYRKSGVDVGRGYKFYQIIPPWFSTGLSTSIHLPLASGACVFMDPRFERDIFIKNIVKHKPNYSVAPTSMYEGFLDEKLIKGKDLSFLKYPFEGGEPLRKEVSDKIEKVFKEHGNDSKLLVGYGQCECGATIASESPYTTHKDGNVGIPLPGVNIAIVDEDMTPVLYNERGQIIVDTPCGMLGYYKNEKATDEYFYQNGDTKWYCTGDIGYIDEEGNLYIEGRMSDYSIVNDKKVYNFDIEKAIMRNSNIKLCDVLVNNGLLSAHIVLNDDSELLNNQELLKEELKRIQESIYEDIQDADFVPYSFKIRDSFPYAKSGKRDTVSLRSETDGFIIIDKYLSHEKKLIRK